MLAYPLLSTDRWLVARTDMLIARLQRDAGIPLPALLQAVVCLGVILGLPGAYIAIERLDFISATLIFLSFEPRDTLNRLRTYARDRKSAWSSQTNARYAIQARRERQRLAPQILRTILTLTLLGNVCAMLGDNQPPSFLADEISMLAILSITTYRYMRCATPLPPRATGPARAMAA